MIKKSRQLTVPWLRWQSACLVSRRSWVRVSLGPLRTCNKTSPSIICWLFYPICLNLSDLWKNHFGYKKLNFNDETKISSLRMSHFDQLWFLIRNVQANILRRVVKIIWKLTDSSLAFILRLALYKYSTLKFPTADKNSSNIWARDPILSRKSWLGTQLGL